MTSRAVHEFRRAELERRIENLIALLDRLDDDPDLEDGADAELNGDESDWSQTEDELPTSGWTGAGASEAHQMIRSNPGAQENVVRYAATPAPPLIYHFIQGFMSRVATQRDGENCP